MDSQAVFNQLRDAICSTATQREVFEWAEDPAVEFAESEDAIDEREESGVSLKRYMADDIAYRLGEQLPSMARDQIGTPTYKADLAKARVGETLAAKLKAMVLQ